MTAAAVAASVALACGLAASPQAGAAVGTVTWQAQKVCTTAAPGKMTCDAMRLVAHHSFGGAATQGQVRAAAAGPAGGYTPTQLAAAYQLDVNATAASTQTVAIVDAFNDPSVKTDLASFDSHYGIPAETATSFRVLNQAGAASPLPANDAGWSGEITLDVQAVRGVCRRCKILLIEANTNSNADLAAGVNRAAALGATEISNSYGGVETVSTNAAYDHAGVVITASTGDDGWYNFDKAFDGGNAANAAQDPAALNTVVGVGGTSLFLNPDGTRASETVWNNNGPKGFYADLAGRSLGAAGGGCSTLSTGRTWQVDVAGFSTLGCASGKRSMTDIAAIADPFTGYDIFQTFGASTAGWQTFGGTSLASPVVAAMWALAGGSGGVKYPSLSLYGHYQSDATRPSYDVTVGGTGICDTASLTSCGQFWSGNPNTLGAGRLDCGFAATGTATVANNAQCYARPGFDGVAGVGAPKGIGSFRAMAPTVVIVAPGTVTHNVTKAFSSAGTRDPFPGGTLTYLWHWGDGATSTGAAPSHKYTTTGAKTITLVVTDNFTRSTTKTLAITVH